ncbi:DUF2155 domain-containing protein [Erythrobacter sp. JK5]|uniref:DUF2155 domain-containing protein n=1 Tax=Erythrobacter sp. JK5 TaxID=2829500 RepID=UPI001BAD7901|nr:DUF2155 domain-containing protein [Erythrobacter sp. JK5]QUL36826.1 DUF2155 domain-containing protein [Erythrobacter sp. JK5]
MLRPPLVAAALFALAACGGDQQEPETVEVPIGESETSQGNAAAAAPVIDAEGATPMEERVATIGLLNKRNNVTEDLEMRPGESREVGPVIVRLSACERTAPWEMPQETGAFVQVEVLERGRSQHTRVFSGWLFKQSPSLNVVEHPIYDVWVKDCAMSFPGE